MKSLSILVVTTFVYLLSVSGLQGQQQTRQQATVPEAASSAAQAPSERLPQLIVPRLVRFSGVVKDALGQPRTGVVGITFAIYKEQEGGAPLWLETQNMQLDEQGRYSVLLGATKNEGVPLDLFTSAESRWLGVQVNLPKELEQARVLLVSVPYALKAADAETLGGKPLSSFVLNEPQAAGITSTAKNTQTAAGTSTKTSATPQAATPCSSVTSDGTATTNSIGLFTTACNIEGSVMSQATINGFPGINLAGNNAGLLLNGTGTHQMQVTGTASSGRLGQDSTGFFFASDTSGKGIKFLTNNGTLNEWMRITGAGNVGIHTQTPGATLDVNGNLNSNGTATASQLISTVPTGTPPLTVASTTLVPNLNAGMLGGSPASAFVSTAASNTFNASQTINSSSGGVALTANGMGASSIGVKGNSSDVNGVGGYFTNSAGGFIFGAVDTSGNPVLAANQSGAYVQTSVADIHNDSTTGTVLNELVKYTSANTVIVTSAGDTGGAIGIVVANAGIGTTVNKATVALFGGAPCVFDNTAVVGDYFQISPTAAGKCHDTGTVYPTNGQQVLGRVTKTSVTPPQVFFFGGGEVRPSPPVYNTSGALQSGHVVVGFAFLSGGTATVTLSGASAYTSNTTYGCSAAPSSAGTIGVSQTSGTSFTLTSSATSAIVTFFCFGN